MSEHWSHFPTDQDLERELEVLGPVMRRQEEADEQTPDPEFVQALRSRLMAESVPQSQAAGSDTLPAAKPPIILHAERRKRRPHFFAGVLTSAAVAAAALALWVHSDTVHSPGVPKGHPVAFAVPTPNATQLSASLPYPMGLGGGGGRNIPPWDDVLSLPPGTAYRGTLQLSPHSLAGGLARLPAFELQRGAMVAARLQAIARTLGINAPVQRSSQADGVWVYASDTTGSQQFNVHSVAVNLSTGELIYHDLRNRNPGFGQAAANDPANVLAARTWLSSIGWPGPNMPLFSFPPGQELSVPQTVNLGWTGIPRADMPEASFYFVGSHQVQSADVYPVVARRSTVPAVSHQLAWAQVLAHKVSVGVAGNVPYPPTNGTGMLRRISVVQVFTRTPSGALYLVPAYRFDGVALLKNVSTPLKWVAVANAVGK